MPKFKYGDRVRILDDSFHGGREGYLSDILYAGDETAYIVNMGGTFLSAKESELFLLVGEVQEIKQSLWQEIKDILFKKKGE